MKRFKEDEYSNIAILRDTIIEMLDDRSYEFLYDKSLTKALTIFDKDDIKINKNISIEIPLIPIVFDEIGKFPKNKDTKNLMKNAIDIYYEVAIDGLWNGLSNPNEDYKYYGLEDLKDMGITNKKDITKNILNKFANLIADRTDPFYTLEMFTWDSSRYSEVYNYSLVFESDFRTFKGTDSVDVIFNMYIVQYERGTNRNKKIVVDSYKPIVFGFTTDIIEGKIRGEDAYIYLSSMLDELTSQF